MGSLCLQRLMLTALGQRAGQPLMRVIDGPEKPFDGERAARTVAGYNLHVSIPITGSDRRGLERQLRVPGYWLHVGVHSYLGRGLRIFHILPT